MTALFHENKIGKFFIVLLVVCLLVSLALAPEAHADALVVAGVCIGAAAMVGAVLASMGVRPGSSHIDYDSVVQSTVTYLQANTSMITNGLISVPVINGVTRVGSKLVSAVRDALLDSSSGTPVLSVGTGEYTPNYSVGTYYSNNSGLVDVTTFAYAYVSSGAHAAFAAKLSESSSFINTCHFCFAKIWGSNTFIYFMDSPQVVIRKLSSGYFTFSFSGNYESFYFTNSINNAPVNVSSGTSLCCDTSTYASNCKYSFNLANWSSPGVSTTKDLNVTDVPQTLNKTDTPDVIYPGWATNAYPSNDVIGIDVNGDGVIDYQVPADSYYPQSIPLNQTDVYDWTQTEAQAGTDEAAADATKEDAEDTEKESADDYQIGAADDYTFDVSEFFPFCIPFDIYDMLNCLAAEPEAPNFVWQFPVLGQTYTISVNLDKFNTVASILRNMEALAFAVGLAFVTKRLIQGGD